MPVIYEDFHNIKIQDYDAVIVGCGFAGSVCARELAERGDMRVLVIEKRNHIAGNMYDEKNEAGILIHQYGPHIFHTNDRRVINYIRKFGGFWGYKHKVLANLNGTFMPVPFNLESMSLAFEPEKAQGLSIKLVNTFGADRKVTIRELREQNDADLAEIAEYVYENIFLHYSLKQWGSKPEELDPEVIDRVPVYISFEDGYFTDEFQGVPLYGYTALFEDMLSHENITVCLNTDAASVFDLRFSGNEELAPLEAIAIKDVVFDGPIVYTGPLDEMFLSRFGRLPYRTLRFEYETLDQEYFQPCATVNYTVSEDFTRITEYKYITGQRCPQTTIVREYPKDYDNPKTEIPYYAILNDENRKHYNVYADLTESLPNFHSLGRLAEYRYYNMDTIIKKALLLSDELIGD